MAKDSRAEYMRDYRKTVKPLGERQARDAGFQDGVEACKRLMIERFANSVMSGREVSALITRHVGGVESHESVQRRQLIASLNPQPSKA